MPVQERWGLELRQEGEEDIDPHIYGDKLLSFHYKWQEPQRNIASGDVVLIKYATKSKSGEYRLGRVVSVEVDPDQLVRTCLVRYSLVQHMSGKDRLSYKGLTVKYVH